MYEVPVIHCKKKSFVINRFNRMVLICDFWRFAIFQLMMGLFTALLSNQAGLLQIPAGVPLFRPHIWHGPLRTPLV